MAQDITERMRTYRGKLREKGLAPVTVWVPEEHKDTVRGYADQLKRGADNAEGDTLALIETLREGGDTWLTIASKLDSQGLRSPSGARWTGGSVRQFATRRGVK